MYTEAKEKKRDEYFWQAGLIFGNKNLGPSSSLPKPQVDSSLIQI